MYILHIMMDCTTTKTDEKEIAMHWIDDQSASIPAYLLLKVFQDR